MLIDAVLYNGEDEMLEFRLQYLWSRVDAFVVMQANNTFSGRPRELSDFGKFSWAKEKLLPSSLHMKPDTNPWINEAIQRNAIIDACNNFSNMDILMLGDIDEIPSHASIDFRRHNSLLYPMTCDQKIIPYHLNNVREDNGWRGTVMCDAGYARQQTTQGLRDMRQRFSPFPEGGWHLTYFGGAEQIRNKIESYSHQEYNRPEFTDIDHIKKCIETGGKLFSGNDEGYSSKIKRVTKDYYPKEFINFIPNHWWSNYDNY